MFMGHREDRPDIGGSLRDEGEAGMVDRSCLPAPHPDQVMQRLVALR